MRVRRLRLPQVLDLRVGIPISISLVYMELAKRVDFPMVRAEFTLVVPEFTLIVPAFTLIIPEFTRVSSLSLHRSAVPRWWLLIDPVVVAKSIQRLLRIDPRATNLR
eukprot:1193804-Prorocentrum_minimum.AAC.2